MRLSSKETNMIRAAEMYYEQRLSQFEIAKALNCSRSTVSRLLAEAIESGIVRIYIKRPVEKFPSLAEKVKHAFDLKEAIVVSGGMSNEQSFNNVGFAAAEFLSQILHDNVIIGISFGVTLSYLVRELSEYNFDYEGIEVIQLMGGLGFGDPAIDGPELAQKMARCLGGSYRYLQAPAVVETAEIAQHLMNEKHIRETIQKAEEAEIVISSVGSLTDNLSSLERSGYFRKEDRVVFQSKGAIGHSLSRMIDENGVPIDDPFNQRLIGAPLSVLRNAKWSIGIGANPLKAHVFLASLKAHQFNVLVLDDGTAREMLRMKSDSVD
ncbi:MAG: winged helix-turn-helix transcriptional regulator [Anaerolineaceae bacterium]|nr:MAG: winged helix-turn-helix transcriptional regulator [Anaerolineaceae bacterium]